MQQIGTTKSIFYGLIMIIIFALASSDFSFFSAEQSTDPKPASTLHTSLTNR